MVTRSRSFRRAGAWANDGRATRMRLVTPASRAEPRRRCYRRALASIPCMNAGSGTMRQLDAAVAALRGVVSITASADALARLSDEVRLLSLRVERLKGAHGRAPPTLPDQSTPMPDRASAKAITTIGGILGPNMLRRFAWLSRPRGGSEQRAARRHGRNSRRGGKSVSAFDMRSLRLVSGAAAILVAAFVTAMTILQAVQPRVHVPTTSGSHRLVARQAQSSLISPVPIWSQSFKPATREHARNASASLDNQRDDLSASDR
jgi:hypothetical protein